MKFQPGQSGNPAGRPAGSRNKKTIAVDEMLAEQTEAAVQRILKMAEDGDPTAMRLCMERMSPTGANRRLGLELPRIKAADDADAAVQLVLDAFGRAEISIRELTCMLAAVDRLVRVGDHVEQMRFNENFRREAERRDWEIDHHFPPYHDTPAAAASETTGKYRAAGGERLHSPVNSGVDSTVPAREGNGNGLYFSVNSSAQAGEEPPPDADGAAPPSPPSDRKRGDG